jgi:glycosyltransferase involved in cell wall biosynthesis
MRYSDTVIAGNSYLAARAKEAGAKRIEIVPTVIDLERYDVKSSSNSSEIIIGWIGSPSTLKYLKTISSVLQYLVKKYRVQIHIVGAKGVDIGISENVSYIEWEENTEAFSISKFNIGIMPLTDSPWEKGKCSYKLIQYMACGLPVVASKVGMNEEVVVAGENGFLANTKEEWIKVLELYIQSPEIRLRHGLAGREKVREKYCVQRTYKLLAKALKEWQ